MTSSVVADTKEPPQLPRPAYLTQDDLARQKAEADAHKAIDQTALISDLSHQLEEALVRIKTLETANLAWHLNVTRLEGARDCLKELLVQMMHK
jgi:hypothetical protein